MIRARFRALASLLASLALLACGAQSERGASLVLVTIDTLRADHLGCYGYPLDTSPTLDALAASGVRFADVTTNWPLTWPALATALTGTLPATHGIRREPRRPLGPESATLAEVLASLGYRTGAVVANANLGTAFGFDQGFDHYVESWMDDADIPRRRRKAVELPGDVKHFTDAERVTRIGVELLERMTADGSPLFFLWLHYIDPHGPYDPPEGYAERFDTGAPPNPVPVEKLPRYQLLDREAVTADLAEFVARYDGEIRYVDDQLARLFDELDTRGLADDTLVVVSSDHGESFDENGYYLDHGDTPFQPSAAVPLILRFPGRLPAGRVVEAPVSLLDLMPTVLELLRAPTPAGVEGSSRAALASGDGGSVDEPVLLEAGAHDETQRAVRSGRWKLVEMSSEDDRRRFGRDALELYDLVGDPREARDVLAENPEVARELSSALRRWPRPAERDAAVPELHPRTRELLRELGYIDP